MRFITPLLRRGRAEPGPRRGRARTTRSRSFIGKIERTDAAFQRELSRTKVGAIKNFYETAVSQPPIPGTVLLFTADTLRFEPVRPFTNVGNLEEPEEQVPHHRRPAPAGRAALLHEAASRPSARTIHVPCVIFDGKSEDFATEMFVIINSTPTRINKSHLVDLYESVSWAAPDKKFAAQVVEKLYSEGDSPLRYKINRLGGRSKQEKWILQAELFNEIHRWASARLEDDREEEPRSARSSVSTAWCATSSRRPRRSGATRGARGSSW